jgi:hypothetical protein
LEHAFYYDMPHGGRGPNLRYPRFDFSGVLTEQAYLVGFRQGDLHVELVVNTIVVKCTSTRREQIELFRRLFAPYGHVYTDEATLIRRKRQSIGMIARLNRTFDFLLDKQDRVPAWVLSRDDTFFAWTAGYLDAEGYFHTYTKRGYRTPATCLEVRSYDAILLTRLGSEFNARGIVCAKASVRVPAGYVNGRGIRSNADLWGLGVHRHHALRLLIAQIEPYVKHGRRRRDMLRALEVLDS